MAWRVAHSLDKLLKQLDGLAPWRSKASDGSIGDAAHATRDSDHNPWYGSGIVTARDFTHDPVNGLDCGWLAECLVASKDSRIKYIIWNRRIIDSRPGHHPWKWMQYTGSNPHTKHLHLSVMPDKSVDDARAWTLTPHLPLDDDMTPQDFFWGTKFDGERNFAQFLKDWAASALTEEKVRSIVRDEMAKTVNVKVTIDGE